MIVIIGAGPAGLAAANQFLISKIPVTIIESRNQIGGQFWRHQIDSEFATPFSSLIQNELVTIKLNCSVWQIEKELDSSFLIHVARNGKTETISAKQILLATGAFDRSIPFAGWTIPGVITQGGLQALAKGFNTSPGKKIVIAGSGPFTYPVANSVTAGTEIVGIFEARSLVRFWRALFAMAINPGKIFEAIGLQRELRKRGLSVKRKRVVVKADRNENGELVAITTSAVDGKLNLIPETLEIIECDIAAISYGFTPDLTLAGILGLTVISKLGNAVVQVNSNQRTSIPNVWAAGEITGVGGHELAIVEGEIAANDMACELTGSKLRFSLFSFNRINRFRKTIFANAIQRIFSFNENWISWNNNSVTICRCEEINLGEITNAFTELAADSVRTAKLLTRCGMGSCQGRICERNMQDITALLVGNESTATNALISNRPIAGVVTLGELSD